METKKFKVKEIAIDKNIKLKDKDSKELFRIGKDFVLMKENFKNEKNTLTKLAFFMYNEKRNN